MRGKGKQARIASLRQQPTFDEVLPAERNLGTYGGAETVVGAVCLEVKRARPAKVVCAKAAVNTKRGKSDHGIIILRGIGKYGSAFVACGLLFT